MTLNVTAANPWFVVQVSDRKLTTRGEPFDRLANKAVVFVCRDAMLAITYTGLGYVGELRTDDWIVEVLDQNKAVNRDVGFVVGQFTEFASRAWADLTAVDRAVRHTFTMAGFHTRGKRQIPYIWTITNENRDGAVVERFRAEYARAKSSAKVAEVSLLQITGAETAVDGDAFAALAATIAGAQDARPIVQGAVDLIRQAADHPEHGRYIGKDCTSITLPRAGYGELRSEYFPEAASCVTYTPQVVTPGIVMRNNELTGPGLTLHWGEQEFHVAGSSVEPPEPGVLFRMHSQRTKPRPR